MPPDRKNIRPHFAVLVIHSEFDIEIIGPYASFKRADGDARVMGGVCIPMTRVDHRTGNLIPPY